MDEKTVEKIVRLSSDPVHIRNICTSAHIDHGKCVSGGSRVMLSDGSFVRADELFQLSKKFGRKASEDGEKVVYDVTHLNLMTYSANPDSGEVELKPITHSWKLKGGEVIEVELRNGFKLATTPEHK